MIFDHEVGGLGGSLQGSDEQGGDALAAEAPRNRRGLARPAAFSGGSLRPSRKAARPRGVARAVPDEENLLRPSGALKGR